jgi:hypothetical protein
MNKIDWKDNKLTEEIRSQLKQGTKVEFRWHGSPHLYTGRIEVNESGTLYFTNEHCYKGEKLMYPGMRYFNTIDSFFHFTHFKIL